MTDRHVQPASLPITAIRVDAPRRTPLNPTKVNTLAESIRVIGLVNPVTVAQDGGLLAGWHRLEACRALGWTDVPCRVMDADDLHRKLIELDENMKRGHMTVLEQSDALAEREELLRAMGLRASRGGQPGNRNAAQNEGETVSPSFSTTAAMAADAGLSERAVQQRKQIATKVIPEAKAALAGTEAANSTRQLLTLARQDEETQRIVADSIAAGTADDVRDALKQLRRTTKQQEREAAPRFTQDALGDRRWQLLHGDSAVMAERIPPGSVDLILTDPPYAEAYVPLHETLAQMAARVLKPGGSLLAMVGHIYLPDVLRLMAGVPGITYHWTLAYLVGGPSTAVWSRHALVGWKPVLWFVKGTYQGDAVPDVYRSDRADKSHHDWGQSEGGIDALLHRFAHPDDLVLDPFVGGGSTAVVALARGCRFIGIDSDEQALRTTAARLAAQAEAA